MTEIFKRRLEKQNDFHFIEHSESGASPSHWRAKWETLQLAITTIGISTSIYVSVRNRWFMPEGEAFLTLSDPEDRERWMTPTQKESEEVSGLRKLREGTLNKVFIKPDTPGGLTISFNFELEGRKHGINFIEDGQPNEMSSTRKTGGRFNLYTSSQIRGGYLSLDKDKNEALDTRTVSIDVFLPYSESKEFLSVLKNASKNAKTFANIDVLAFRPEIERSLGDPGHFHDCYFEKAADSPVVLTSLGVTEPTKFTQPSEKVEPYRPPQEISNTAPQQLAFPLSIKIAIWVIAVAALVSTLK